MARIQILELPEGPDDDRPPFVLVIDQYQPQRYIIGPDQPEPIDEFEGIAQKIGARAVLVFADQIDIPANEVPVDPDGYPLRIRVEPDFNDFRTQVDQEIRSTLDRAAHAISSIRDGRRD
ncbi:hypothetical protein [Streptomyces lavendofoliae]|uniref:Uncharacterized protein n=1 Tax=Streptomyces lavendofoliae TaxID=67314 RepID=A0A918I507_9ACTN|nr:hypothetical protein [Streptomyces lavendofoliae]GGU62790.1 hypothetical protein GCM10010274_59530 [Streptomyces lavendofoliae]